MRINGILLVPGSGAFFDQAAIRIGAAQRGFIYAGEPIAPGFMSIRVPASSPRSSVRSRSDRAAWSPQGQRQGQD
ncbi:MAG: hypothetical protein E5W25_16615, partial [Mesorhizobium sp.]